MDARGAESESGSAFSAATAGDAVDFRLPVDWKNVQNSLLCRRWVGGSAVPPEAGFRRDIARPGVNSPRANSPRAA